MLLSILGLTVELGNVAFEVESVEAAGKIGLRLFDVVATICFTNRELYSYLKYATNIGSKL